ncbi:MAG: UDP-3-O-acyl-N-acetylglucosamine deacetylase [Methylocystis sp.]|nr:UDP-3-O-acyl-N-acetylglucosamine deacetylase [Methylocystis sp.]
MSTQNQQTLAREFTCQGRGLHTGQEARLTVKPAAPNSGYRLRAGGCETRISPAIADGSRHRTVIRWDEAEVHTVEHLLAALAGLGVDNALIALDGDEIPAMDGSAAAFVEAIDEAGVVSLAAPRRVLRVTKTVRVSDGAGWAEFSPAASGLTLDLEIAFGAGIDRQRLALALSPESFRRELAPARSFGFLRDAERLWRGGLALGASLENTIVLDGDRVINPEGLRFQDECVRHKMLDVIGDLALAGAPLIGAFRSYRGGHGLNLALLKAAARQGALRLDDGPSAREGRDTAAIISPEENPFL